MDLIPHKLGRTAAGDQHGRLTVLETLRQKGTYRYYAKCRCQCGNVKTIRVDGLVNGSVESCGCLRRERITSHRMTGHRLYHTWKNMLSRCLDPKCAAYPRYGGAGITVCERWKDLSLFVADMYPTFREGLSIDRIDNEKGYTPENCRWATRAEQSENRRSVRRYTFQGETKSIAEWSESCGVCYGTLWDRLTVQNWPIEKAVTTPAQKMRRHPQGRD